MSAIPSPSGGVTAAPRTHLATMTSIRFFAAMWVVIYHITLLIPSYGGPFAPLAEKGALGVPLFFVLSGFILAYTYSPRIDDGGMDNKAFFRARFARVYPLYFAAVILGALQQTFAPNPATAPLFSQEPIASFASNLLLVQNWSPNLVQAINGPGWSIACEAAFYLAFPLVAPPLLRISPRKLILVALAVVAANPLLEAIFGNLTATLMASGAATPGAMVPNALLGATYLPFARIDEFLLGILAFRAAGMLRVRGLVALSAMLALAGLGATRMVQIALADVVLPSGARVYSGSTVTTLFPILAALLLVGLAQTGGERPRWLAHPWLVYGGKISFALYLVHMPILYCFFSLTAVTGNPALLLTLGLVTALAVASAAHHWIEEPARRWISGAKRRVRHARNSSSAAPTAF